MKYFKPLCSVLLFASAVTAFGQATSATAPAKPYTVVDGYKVDANTLQGFKTWRSAACDRCHGANQEGLVRKTHSRAISAQLARTQVSLKGSEADNSG